MYKMVQEYMSCPIEPRRFTFNEWSKRVDADFGQEHARLIDWVDDHRGVIPGLTKLLELVRYMEFNTIQNSLHSQANIDELRGRNKALREIHDLIQGIIPKEEDNG